MHGLSQAEALTFRRDASRLKYESHTSHELSLRNHTCLVYVFGGGAAAVVELAPKEASWKRDYQILAHVLGLRFQRLFGTMNGCLPQPPIRIRWQQRLAAFNRWLTCNLTIDVAEVVRTAKAMEAGCVDKCDQGSRLWGRG